MSNLRYFSFFNSNIQKFINFLCFSEAPSAQKKVHEQILKYGMELIMGRWKNLLRGKAKMGQIMTGSRKKYFHYITIFILFVKDLSKVIFI
jgi:hypothetical protein